MLHVLLSCLQIVGMSSEEAVEHYCGVNLPTLLAMYGMEKMKGTVAYLEGLGVDVTKVVNGHPAVFGLSMDNMKGTVAYLEAWAVPMRMEAPMAPTTPWLWLWQRRHQQQQTGPVPPPWPCRFALDDRRTWGARAPPVV